MSLQKPCFEVPSRRRKRDNSAHDDASTSTPEDFDDIDALDAASYLSRVRAQARRLPDIFESSAKPTTTVSSPTKKAKLQHDENEVITGSAASLHFMLSSNNNKNTTHGIQPPPSSQHVPAGGVQWVEQTLASFSQLRRYLEQCQSQGVGRDKSRRLPVPPMKDRIGWCTFCVGVDAAVGNRADGYYDDDGGDDDNQQKEQELPAWRQSLPPTGFTPTTSLLLQLDQVMVRRVLAHLTHYFCEHVRCDTKTQQQQQHPQQQRLLSWLYALTARLERPIHRDDAVTLYTLLKALTAARAATASDARPALATLNVLIAVVGIYLEQGGGYANVMQVKQQET